MCLHRVPLSLHLSIQFFNVAKKIIDYLRITLITFILVFLSGNIYAYMRLTALKRNSYRSHNKYADIFKNRYKKNIDTEEVNLYGDLCSIEGTYELCKFSDGKRRHQFKTDQYGYKTRGNTVSYTHLTLPTNTVV